MSNLKIGDPIIEFKLPGVDNCDYSLDDYRDKPALAVIFTCNHCPYAQAWEDRIIAIQSDYGVKGLQIIAVSSNDAVKYPDDSFPKMKERAQAKGFNFPYVYDESQAIARAYGAERTPEVFLFDQSRKLRYHGAVDDNYENPDAVKATYLRDALDAVLSGQALATPETPPVGCTIKWKN